VPEVSAVSKNLKVKSTEGREGNLFSKDNLTESEVQIPQGYVYSKRVITVIRKEGSTENELATRIVIKVENETKNNLSFVWILMNSNQILQ
jgi:hypothetical protein